MPADDDGVVGAVRHRRTHVVLLPQGERLAAGDANERRNRGDPERERRVQQRGPEDRGEADCEDQEREGEKHVGHPRDRGVEPAPVVAGDEPDGNRDHHREHRGEEPRLDRGPRAPDDARKGVAAELVRTEQVLPRRAGEDRVEVGLVGRVRSDPAGEDRREHRADDDDQRDDGGRPAQEAPAQDPPPPRPRPERSGFDVAHCEVPPETRMRGLITEYVRSTKRLTTT